MDGTWMHAYATRQGCGLCLKVVEGSREELPYSRSRVSNSGLCLEDMEALSLWQAV